MRKNLRHCVLFALLTLSRLTQAPGQASEAPTVRLDDLVRLALERNPRLKAAARGVDIMQAKVSPARTLPDPELMFGQMNEGSIIPFATLGDPDAGFSEIYVGFTQELPFPGKFALRGKVTEMEARAEISRYRSGVLDLISQVKVAFYIYTSSTTASRSLARSENCSSN